MCIQLRFVVLHSEDICYDLQLELLEVANVWFSLELELAANLFSFRWIFTCIEFHFMQNDWFLFYLDLVYFV